MFELMGNDLGNHVALKMYAARCCFMVFHRDRDDGDQQTQVLNHPEATEKERSNQRHAMYPLVMTDIAVENGHL